MRLEIDGDTLVGGPVFHCAPAGVYTFTSDWYYRTILAFSPGRPPTVWERDVDAAYYWAEDKDGIVLFLNGK